MSGVKDNLVLGVLIGILSPVIACTLFLYFMYPDENVVEILQGYAMRNVLTHVISLSVIINLPVFFILLYVSRENAARGVLGATIMYAFLILILKLI